MGGETPLPRGSVSTGNPSRSYRYEVFPMRGKPGKLERADSLTFDLRPSAHEADGIGVYTNRGVTAAMAYLQRFEGKHPSDVPDGAASRWLERGLKTVAARLHRRRAPRPVAPRLHDENSILVRGDKRFAAMIATEFLRMYDHYLVERLFPPLQPQSQVPRPGGLRRQRVTDAGPSLRRRGESIMRRLEPA